MNIKHSYINKRDGIASLPYPCVCVWRFRAISGLLLLLPYLRQGPFIHCSAHQACWLASLRFLCLCFPFPSCCRSSEMIGPYALALYGSWRSKRRCSSLHGKCVVHWAFFPAFLISVPQSGVLKWYGWIVKETEKWQKYAVPRIIQIFLLCKLISHT